MVHQMRTLLADVAGIGPFFAVVTDVAAPGEGWVAVRVLGEVDGPLADRIAVVGAALGVGRRTAETGGPSRTVPSRVAASIAFQGIAAQVVAPLFAAVAVHGVLPDAAWPGTGSGDRRDAALAPRWCRPVAVVAGRRGPDRPCPDPDVLAPCLPGCSRRWSPPCGRRSRCRTGCCGATLRRPWRAPGSSSPQPARTPLVPPPPSPGTGSRRRRSPVRPRCAHRSRPMSGAPSVAAPAASTTAFPGAGCAATACSRTDVPALDEGAHRARGPNPGAPRLARSSAPSSAPGRPRAAGSRFAAALHQFRGVSP